VLRRPIEFTCANWTGIRTHGTLDERVAVVLFDKSGVLEVMTGGDHTVIEKTKQRAGGPVFASSTLVEMVGQIKRRVNR
jgi:hypothetical protein